MLSVAVAEPPIAIEESASSPMYASSPIATELPVLALERDPITIECAASSVVVALKPIAMDFSPFA